MKAITSWQTFDCIFLSVLLKIFLMSFLSPFYLSVTACASKVTLRRRFVRHFFTHLEVEFTTMYATDVHVLLDADWPAYATIHAVCEVYQRVELQTRGISATVVTVVGDFSSHVFLTYLSYSPCVYIHYNFVMTVKNFVKSSGRTRNRIV